MSAAARADAFRRGPGRRCHDGGAYLLAGTGLLDGRRATTHWRFADDLAARFPAVAVAPDALYVDEDRLLSGAGVVAGIDRGVPPRAYRQAFGRRPASLVG